MAGASNQNLFRSNGYVGREIRRRRSPECSASHFGCNPPAQSEPTERSRSIELCSPYDASPKEENNGHRVLRTADCVAILPRHMLLARVLSTLPGPTSTRLLRFCSAIPALQGRIALERGGDGPSIWGQ